MTEQQLKEIEELQGLASAKELHHLIPELLAEVRRLREELDNEKCLHELTKLALARAVPPPPQTSTATDIFTA